MNPVEELLAEQAARLATIDPMLPGPAAPPDGELVEAATPEGQRVGGVLHRQRHPPAERWRLYPVVGDTGTDGMDALLRALRARLDRESPPAGSACVVDWPSRDAEAARAFLDHGLVPLTVLAVRGPGPGARPAADVVVRRAGPGDFDRVLALVSPELRRGLDGDGPVWLAERSGRTIGVACCGWAEPGPADLLPAGRWGRVHHVGVLAETRGTGVGRALAAAAHAEFHRRGTRGSYLYYHLPDPVSSVFWHRQGYRPLWTFWEVRPASALR